MVLALYITVDLDCLHCASSEATNVLHIDNMPDEGRETRYYNQTTATLEWRCKYCAQSYALRGGTNILTSISRLKKAMVYIILQVN